MTHNISAEDVDLFLFGIVVVINVIVLSYLVYISWQLIMGIENVSRSFFMQPNVLKMFVQSFLARPQRSSAIPNSLRHRPLREFSDSFNCTFTNWQIGSERPPFNVTHSLCDHFIYGSNLHPNRDRFDLQEVHRRRSPSKCLVILIKKAPKAH